MLDLDDERIANLADVLGNKTCKKILEHLADKEASETEIARDLNLPANTINYNIGKLLKAGLIEKTKDFFWSVKGRKILKYTVSNKKVVISPKSSKGIFQVVSAIGIVGVSAFLIKIGSIKFLSEAKQSIAPYENDIFITAGEGAINAVKSSPATEILDKGIISASQLPNLWLWFLAGGIFALAVYFLAGKLRKFS